MRVREGERGGEGERGRERGGRGERGRDGGRGGERVSEGERGRGRVQKRIHMHMQVHSHTHIIQQADMHTHCVPIIMYCTPTQREISVTTRADKVFLMPAQVLGSDTWLQRERETERVGTNRIIHTVSMNWNNNFM